MASKKQRLKNRQTNLWLKEQHVCPNCKEKGRHLKVLPQTMEEFIHGDHAITFWTCPKFADQQPHRAG